MQQINLYHDQFKPKKQLPWFAITVLALMFLLLGMTAVWWLQQQRISQLRLRKLQAEQVQQQSSQTLEILQQQVAAQHPDFSLQQQLQRLQQQLRARQPLRQALQQAMARKSVLPDVLEGLANKPFDGLWCTVIAISDGGAHLRLEGTAVAADRVPVFVSVLNSMPVFRQYHFSQLQLKRQENGLYSFVLSTQMEETQ